MFRVGKVCCRTISDSLRDSIKMAERFAVLGCGAWGTAVAIHLASLGHEVRLFCAREATANALKFRRERETLLPGIAIPDSIPISADANEATRGADHWIIAIPTAFLRETLKRLTAIMPPKLGIVSLTKGLEIGTFRRPTEIIAETLPASPRAALSGPSHAEEVARRLPTSLVVAAEDLGYAQHVRQVIGSERLRIYSSSDLVGVELAGAVKNVLAIAAGVCDGLGFGDNAKAALLTRGLVEMTRFGVAHGAEAATFQGLAGVGDLIATCFSPHGRNRRAGERLARGVPVTEIIAGPQIVEGYFTAKSVHERSRAMGLEMPIAASVYELLYEGKPASKAVQDLLTRRQRDEGTP
jgi:glycerol-3-phosphate dehydrogenase (NAD(P)+)